MGEANTMIWNETKECMSRDEKIVLQSARPVKTVDRVYHNVPFYRKKMQSIGIEPGDVRGVEDLHILPFTTKADLRDNYPFGLFAVPQSEIVRIHASSGTTGKATVVINMESLMDFTVTGYARPHNLRQPVNIMSMYMKPLFHLEAHIFRPRLRAANCRL